MTCGECFKVHYETLFQILIKLADWCGKIKSRTNIYNLCKTHNDFRNRAERTRKKKFFYQKKRIKYYIHLENIKELNFKEFLRLERILPEVTENPNVLAKTCFRLL